MVAEVSEQVAVITAQTEDLTADDIALVSEIISDIASLDEEGIEVGIGSCTRVICLSL